MKHLLTLTFMLVLLSSSSGQLHNCFDLSPYFKVGQDPRLGDDVPREQLIRALTIIRPYCDCIRTFAAGAPLDSIAYLAREMGFSTIVVGAWLDSDSLTNNQEIERIIQLAEDGVADRLVIGSETLLRGDLTPNELLYYLAYVKSQVPDIPITTAEVYGLLLDNLEIIDAVDFIFYNAYPYWEGESIDCALYNFNQAYLSMEAVAGSKPIWISETGWPSQGNTIGAAVPSEENLLYYLRHIRAWCNYYDIPVFWFSAFKEPWKYTNINPQEAFWGLICYDEATDSLYYLEGVEDVLLEEINPDTSLWSCKLVPNEVDTPRITLTNIPIYGDQNGIVCGVVDGIRPCDFNLVMYIRVNNTWWVKPTYANKITRISCDGSFCIDVVTGGLDRNATDFFLALIPSEWDPPRIGNQSSLPDSLYDHAVTYIHETRTPFSYGGIGVIRSESDVRPLDTIETEVFVQDIDDVLFFQGTIHRLTNSGPNFIAVHSVYDDGNLEVILVDSSTITFQFNTPENIIPYSIPDSTVIFTIRSFVPLEARFCRHIGPSNEILPLEVVHFVDNEPKHVPLLSKGIGVICPIVPLKVGLEAIHDDTSDTTQVLLIAEDLTRVASFDLLLEADEGLKFTEVDSIYIEEDGVDFEILNDNLLRVWFNPADDNILNVYWNPRICSFKVAKSENVTGCYKVRFSTDTMSLTAYKEIFNEIKDAYVEVINDLEVCITSSKHFDLDYSLEVYPNPIGQGKRLNVNVESLNSSPKKMQIFDVNGKIVLDERVNSRNLLTPPLNFHPGTYLLLLYGDANELLGGEKIIILK